MHAVADQLSYAEYLALAETSDELLEYHDGVVVAMVAPSAAHARIVGQLTRLLDRSSKPACAAIPAGLKIHVEATNRTLIPDVTVVCGPIEYSTVDAQAVVNPVVICEVLSPSTENYDQGAKLHQYRRLPTLREYVVVAQDRRFVSICRRVGDLWSFDDVEASGSVKLESLGLEFDLGRLYTDGIGVIVD